jgi:hypothetical protein
MKLTQLLKSKLLPVTAGAVVVALAAGGVAYASSPSTTTSPTTTSASSTSGATTSTAGAATHPVLRADVIWLVHHTVHAQLVVDTKHGYRTIEIDKGKLLSDSSGLITIVRPDGPRVSARLTSSTKYYGLSESQLAPGDGVALVQGGGNAIYVASRAPTSTSGTSNG